MTALSVPLLREKVGPRRWAAIVVGFFGFWIISKFVSNIKTLREEA